MKTKRVRVDSLTKGQEFVALGTGRKYTFDHDHRGCCYVVRDDGEETMFAGCATAILNTKQATGGDHHG